MKINQSLFKITIADTFIKRFKGLLATASLAENEGLLLIPCNSVHMMGMRYSIDVAYLDREGCIVKLVENLRPWYGCSFCLSAYSALEVQAGTIRRCGWEIGEKLIIE